MYPKYSKYSLILLIEKDKKNSCYISEYTVKYNKS